MNTIKDVRNIKRNYAIEIKAKQYWGMIRVGKTYNIIQKLDERKDSKGYVTQKGVILSKSQKTLTVKFCDTGFTEMFIYPDVLTGLLRLKNC